MKIPVGLNMDWKGAHFNTHGALDLAAPIVK
jgi:hypothetical protein